MVNILDNIRANEGFEPLVGPLHLTQEEPGEVHLYTSKEDQTHIFRTDGSGAFFTPCQEALNWKF